MYIMTSSIIDAIGVEFSDRDSKEVTNNIKNILNGSYFDEMEEIYTMLSKRDRI